MSRYKFLGVNDDSDFCECCGRTDLKRVVWIEDTETEVVKHYGTTCATNPDKAFGNKVVKEIRTVSAKYELRVNESIVQAYQFVKRYMIDAQIRPYQWPDLGLSNEAMVVHEQYRAAYFDHWFGHDQVTKNAGGERMWKMEDELKFAKRVREAVAGQYQIS